MTIFDDAFSALIEFEGVESNDPNDPGGHTKYGISKRYNPDIDIDSLTPDIAKEYYRRRWWEANNYHLIAQSKIAIKAFITAVNLGPTYANSLLQQAINDCSSKNNIRIGVDGTIFKYTLSALNVCDTDAVLNQYRILIAKTYLIKVKKDPEKKKYIVGWIDRALA